MSKKKTVRDIITDYLTSNGYDGLCSENCGCGIDCLAPCGNIRMNCQPAYKQICTECGDCDHGEKGEPCYKPVKAE